MKRVYNSKTYLNLSLKTMYSNGEVKRMHNICNIKEFRKDGEECHEDWGKCL